MWKTVKCSLNKRENILNIDRFFRKLLGNRCKHPLIRETNFVRPFTIDKITGVLPIFICLACGKELIKNIHA